MAKTMLVIDRDDQGQLFLSVEEGTLTVGDSPRRADVVLRNLHISRILCEIDIDKDVLVCEAVPAPGAVPVRQDLHAGMGLHLGHSRLRLEPAANGQGSAGEAETARPPAAGAGELSRRLSVIDGADKGRSYRLPATGSITLGKSAKHADIALGDLLVARVHCQVEIQADRILVTPLGGENGTCINGQKITTPQELRPGDVLRIGNSHLRLDTTLTEDEPVEDVADPTGAAEKEKEVAVVADERPATAAGPAEPVRAAPAPIDRVLALEGQVLGHYRIVQLLGRGQHGVVFRAQNLKNNLVVAFKVLPPDFPASGEELQHFVQAFKTATPLHHTHLLALHGAGRTGPFCWIAREYIDGENALALAQRLQEKGKLYWAQALRVAVQLARVLAFLHQHKVVHGNLTPANVLIRSSDKQTKLADLMFAQALKGSRLEQAMAENKLLAELPYLAPEQAEPGTFVDGLANLYNLGAVVYTLLAGQPPFSGSSVEILRTRVRDTPPVRPSTYQRGIPVAFEGVVLKLLAKHQEDRYQTAAELCADVEALAAKHEIGV